MCSPKIPEPPPLPLPPPDFADETAALALRLTQQEQRRAFAGLASSFSGSAHGVLNPAATTATAGVA